MSASGTYLRGQTVRLTARVSEPDTEAPSTGLDVTLAALRLDTSLEQVEDVVGESFTEEAGGYYVFGVDTEDLDPGLYHWRVLVDDGPDALSAGEDSFLLVEPVA